MPPKNRLDTTKIAEVVDRLRAACHAIFSDEPTLESIGDIVKHVNRLRSLQDQSSKPVSLSEGAQREAMQHFVEWFVGNGGEMKKLKLDISSQSEEGLQLFTTEPIAKDELTVRVPSELILSRQNIDDCEPLAAFLRDDPFGQKLPPTIQLALLVLYEDSKISSKWRDYLRVLPRRFHTPLYWSQTELETLRGSAAATETVGMFKRMVHMYCTLYSKFLDKVDALFSTNFFTWSRFLWATSIVHTRQNRVPLLQLTTGDYELTECLIPMWDMCNHEQPPNTLGEITTTMSMATGVCECRAMRDYSKINEPFTIFYGARTNAQLLLYSGFVYDNNTHDAVPANLCLVEGWPLYKEKRRLLERLELLTSDTDNFALRPASLDERLSAFLRILVLEETELEEAKRVVEDRLAKKLTQQTATTTTAAPTFPFGTLSFANELNMLKLFKSSVVEILSHYEGAAAVADANAVASSNGGDSDSYHIRLGQTLIKGEKTIARATLDLIMQQEKKVQKKIKDKAKRAQKKAQGKK